MGGISLSHRKGGDYFSNFFGICYREIIFFICNKNQLLHLEVFAELGVFNYDRNHPQTEDVENILQFLDNPIKENKLMILNCGKYVRDKDNFVVDTIRGVQFPGEDPDPISRAMDCPGI